MQAGDEGNAAQLRITLRRAAERVGRGDVDHIGAEGIEIAARGANVHLELLPPALDLLAAQPWRGNTRELRNVLEQLALRSDSPQIGAAQVEQVLRDSGLDRIEPALSRPAAPVPAMAADDDLRPLPVQIAELERRAIAAALARTGGNRVAAAKLLGISRASLYDRLSVSENQTTV